MQISLHATLALRDHGNGLVDGISSFEAKIVEQVVSADVVQLLAETDVEKLIGGGRHERSGDRTTYRNGYRDRALDTRLGALQLAHREAAAGKLFPSLPRAQEDFGGAFLYRPLAGEWPYLWLDATCRRQREGDRIVPVAVMIAVAANTDGKREIVGLHIGPSEAETFWATFLKSMVRRGLHRVTLVIADAHEALKAAIRRIIGASWQRCRVHWMRNALSCVPKGQQSMVFAALRQAFIQPDRPAASQMLRHVADQLRVKWPKLAAFIDDSEGGVLAHMGFPTQHRSKSHSTNPLERLNKEVKRRADVVGIFPNEGAIIRPIGAALLEANDEWQLQDRYMQTEAMAELTPPLLDAVPTQIATVAA